VKAKKKPGKFFPRSVAWAVDSDYKHKLTEKEREWLEDFNERYYGADFRREGATGKWRDSERRVRYVAKNASNRDCYSAQPVEELTPQLANETEGSLEAAPTPPYQHMTLYKQLLAAYRADPTNVEAKRTLETFVNMWSENKDGTT
jgi:hypothetical protein